MKRFHIHIAVNELAESISFYSILFNAAPSLEREDYAKWDLSDPAVNFAISNRGHSSGINHLGMQVDSDNELEEIAKRLDKAEINAFSQIGSSCCYASSNKHWALDPQGIAWESFHTLGEIPIFGKDSTIDVGDDKDAACCIPNENDQAECCS